MTTKLIEIGKRAKHASFELAQFSQQQKNNALEIIAKSLEDHTASILKANTLDIQKAKQNGLSDALIDRLLLTEERLIAIANDVRNIISLADPVGQILDGGRLDSGLEIKRVCVPLGVVGAIYEARPNVTIDIATLCLKTGNAVILRGGSETQHSNIVLVEVIQKALKKAELPENSVQLITDTDRQLVLDLLKLDQYVDMIIPRGGAKLQELCKQHSTIPVIIGGIGVCHLFVEETANLEKSIPVIENAKTQRPSTCNTLETLLVQHSIAEQFLPKLAVRLQQKFAKFHCDPTAYKILEKAGIEIQATNDEKLRQEWLSTDLNIVVVENFEQAITHIREYGSQHSDGILTQNPQLADLFIRQVDSACVYVNTSTRFTDGAQFGLGAEVAVSTQKLHARGPMGLDALTTYKWVCSSDYASRS
ncbi:glutamate-5-semialdehyde dehydrogenase [Pasteurella atlantica]|uniref:glutamate-5-semialdehyde dehydrogenase n=1 Tax=Pasteurellaceae TaxID=712 RepID=UPI0027650168|nr:glutamate-5-semialdehyde dehydrogenase [Pasteurella atlantica]MDP8034538.1 glutamate-5-semialdehyde dehydrogenase [Pasteurella atlantica]MDP8036464.1 glutamate-5-semialdehyde dehydrogenase [Pasteurella atlantica]MDP8038423.1 glutamate-5-semialdehyde dehydrogenase [Pasteurella atlantica]MDP8048774.1 glutamate-5-semialdehyde dehydrogenase [Pasteurella atlantica]MDP8050731.1 glutamate-5-semialdehyde dehydrogenase [Pasteurella atlantica]